LLVSVPPGSVLGQLESYPISMGPTLIGCTVEKAFEEQQRSWGEAVRTVEIMHDLLRPCRGKSEDDAAASRAEGAAEVCFPVQIAFVVSDQTKFGKSSVIPSEGVENGFDSGGIYLIDHSAAAAVCTRRAISSNFSRAVEITASVQEESPSAGLSSV
jgi:hypothetical protein